MMMNDDRLHKSKICKTKTIFCSIQSNRMSIIQWYDLWGKYNQFGAKTTMWNIWNALLGNYFDECLELNKEKLLETLIFTSYFYVSPAIFDQQTNILIKHQRWRIVSKLRIFIVYSLRLQDIWFSMQKKNKINNNKQTN